MQLASDLDMLRLLSEGLRRRLRPAAAAQAVIVQGGTLQVPSETGPARSLSLLRMRVYVPEELAYGVEYRVSDHGEFRITRAVHGQIIAKSRFDAACSIPVCWMPGRMVGKNADRFIVRIGVIRVNLKAGSRDVVRS